MQEVTDPSLLQTLNSSLPQQQPQQQPKMKEVTDPETLHALNEDTSSVGAFFKGATKNFDEYASSINKGLDYASDFVTGRDTKFFEDNKDYWNKQSDLNDIETANHPYARLGGQILLDPINLTPTGIVKKGQTLGRIGEILTKTKPRAVATSMGLGSVVGAGTTAFKDYGNDNYTQAQKNENMAWGAGIVSVINGIISGVTKGKVNDAIKDEAQLSTIIKNHKNFKLTEEEAKKASLKIQEYINSKKYVNSSENAKNVNDNLLKNGSFFGLNKNQDNGVMQGVMLQGKYPKVDEKYRREQAGFKQQYTPNFQMRPNHPPSTMDKQTALSVLAKEADRKRTEQGLQPIYQRHYEIPEQYRKESVYPKQPEQPYNPNFVSGDFNNNIPVPYNEDAELMQRYNKVASHPRLQELLRMRENVSAKDSESPQRQVSRGGYRELDGYGGENKHAYDYPLNEKNYNYDFHLTKQDIGKLYRGKYDDNLLSKLETDLDTLDNHPDYAEHTNNIDYSKYKEDNTHPQMNEDDWKEANELFAKGIDNLAVGTYAGVGQDENGNITFDPEKFILGLGGYTAVKQALKNGTIRGKLKEIATDAINKVNFNPEIQKEGNSFNSMFVGANSKNDAKSYAKKSVVDLGGHDITKANFGDKNGELEIFEKSPFAQGRNSINHIEVPDNLRRSGKGTELLNKAKNEYDNISAQASNENSVRFFYKNGFRPTFNKDLSVDDAIKAFKENGSSLNMEWRKGIEKGAFSDTATKKTMKEIDDSKAKVSNGTWGTSEDIKRGNSTVARLDEILDHKELFEKYPELKNTIVHLKPDMQGASFDADANRITVGYDTKTKSINKSSLLHEIQHSIQAKEGWARGGSPDNIHPKDMYETIISKYGNLPAIEKIENDFLDSKIPTENEMYEKVINMASNNYGGIEKLKYDTYRRLHGEQQARATQHRMDYTPEQRQSEDWTKTLKDAEGEYKEPIIKYDDGINEMSPVKSKSQKNTRGAYNVLHNEKQSAEIGRGISDEKILLEKGSHWYKNNEIKGYGISKLIEKHINKQKDLTPTDIIHSPQAMEQSESYINKGNLVFDFPSKDNSKFRIVFTKKLDKNKKPLLDNNGNEIWTNASMFRRGKGGRLESLHNQLSKETGSQSGEFSALQSSSEKKIIPQKKQKSYLERVQEKREAEGLPEKGTKIYHPLREKEYYLGDSGTVYFKRGNGKYREMPNEEIRNDIHTIAKIGTNKFKAEKLAQDEELEKSFKKAEVAQNEDSYKMEHTAPTADEVNSRADDVTNSFSDDIYSKDAQRLHGHGNPTMDKESIEVINKVKDNPNAEVTIYRAIPKDVDAGINSKDWVTISKEYAKSHGESVLDGNYKIVEKKVKAKDLWTDGNSIHEWGYDPHTEPTKLMANGMHSMAGGFAGGADSLINQRDYNGDGKYDYKDLLAGVVAGTISINALKKLAPKLFEEEEGGVKAGVFAGNGKKDVKKGYEHLKQASGLKEETAKEEKEKTSALKTKLQEAKKKGYAHLTKIVGDEAAKEWGDATSVFKRLFTDTLGAEYHNLRESATASTNGMIVKLERMHNALKELSEADRTGLHEYTAGESKDINPALKPFADVVKKQIDDMSKELIDLGVLTKEQYDEWAGYYIHRNYEEHFFKDIKGMMKKGFKIDDIHKRGNIEEITATQAKKLLIDPKFIASIKLPIREGGQRLTKKANGKYEFRRDWTKAEREAMKEITDGAITIPETLMRLKRMADNATFLKNVSNIDEVVLKDAEKFTDEEIKASGFTKVPNNPKYGVLAGKHIRKDVFSDISARNDEIYNTFRGENEPLARIWKNYLSLWKKSKTVWNAPSHLNNLLSNTYLMHLAGMRADEITVAFGKAGKMMYHGDTYDKLLQKKMIGKKLTQKEEADIAEIGENLKYYFEAKDSGLFGRSQLNDILAGQQDKIKKRGILGKIDKFSEDMYHGEDEIGKLAMYSHLREKVGMSADEARKAVLTIIPDYSKPMPAGYRALRDTGISPFISWSYYTMPAIWKLMKTKQGAKKATIAMGTLSAMEYALTGGAVTPIDNLPFVDGNKPDSFKGRRFGIHSNGDKITTLKTDRWIPYIELMNPYNFLVSNVSGVTSKAGFNFLSSATQGGMIDPYYGRPVTSKNKSAGQKTYDYAKYLTQSYVPAPSQLFTAWNTIESLARSKKNRRTNKVIEPRTTGQELLKNLGLNSLSYSKSALKKEQQKK